MAKKGIIVNSIIPYKRTSPIKAKFGKKHPIIPNCNALFLKSLSIMFESKNNAALNIQIISPNKKIQFSDVSQIVRFRVNGIIPSSAVGLMNIIGIPTVTEKQNKLNNT